MQVATVDKYQPNYDSDMNGPAEAFAVWCPLAYMLFGTESAQEKDTWIAAIEDSREVCFRCKIIVDQ